MMKQIFILLSWMILSFQANAQFFQLMGKVSSPDGDPLPGASVYLENSTYGTVTNTEGKFVFTNLNVNKLTLVISFVGYETYKEEIILKTNIDRHFILYPANILGEEVIVRAVRASSNDPFACTNITSEYFSKQNTGKDIPVLLSMAPSVVSSSDTGNGIGTSSFRIRGADVSRINVTINGVPLNDSESHSVYWVNMPDFISSVKNLQIQRGVGTSSNGSAAFGASINIQTIPMNKNPYAEISQSFGSYNTRKSTMTAGTGLLSKNLALDMRLSTIKSDGYIERASSDLNSYYLSAGLYYPHSTIKFITFSGKEKTYQAWDGVSGDLIDINRRYNGAGKYLSENGEENYYDNETDNYNQKHNQLHFLKEFSSKFFLNAVVHYTRGRGYYEQYKENQKLADYLIPDVIIGAEIIKKSDIIRRKWLDNHFYGTIFSLIYKSNKYENIFGGGYNHYYGDHYGDVIWARYAGNTEINHRWYENTGIKKDFNIFNKINYNLFKDINIFADLQIRGIAYDIEGLDDDLININQNHNYMFFNPKFGFNYDISNDQRLYISFATAHREPNRSDFKDAKKGAPTPKPEVLYDYETGYSIRSSNVSFDVNLFYMDYNNQLVLTGEINNIGGAIMRNVKDSYRSGIEIISSVKLLTGLQWNTNITISRNKIKNLVLQVDNWDYWNDPDNNPMQYSFPLKTSEISFSPAVIASNSFEYNMFNRVFIEVNSKYVGKQFIDMSGSEDRKLNPYSVSDIILYIPVKSKFTQDINFSFTLANIFNKKYISNAWVYRYFENNAEKRTDGFFPQAGTHFLAGINFKF